MNSHAGNLVFHTPTGAYAAQFGGHTTFREAFASSLKKDDKRSYYGEAVDDEIRGSTDARELDVLSKLVHQINKYVTASNTQKLARTAANGTTPISTSVAANNLGARAEISRLYISRFLPYKGKLGASINHAIAEITNWICTHVEGGTALTRGKRPAKRRIRRRRILEFYSRMEREGQMDLCDSS